MIVWLAKPSFLIAEVVYGLRAAQGGLEQGPGEGELVLEL